MDRLRKALENAQQIARQRKRCAVPEHILDGQSNWRE